MKQIITMETVYLAMATTGFVMFVLGVSVRDALCEYSRQRRRRENRRRARRVARMRRTYGGWY